MKTSKNENDYLLKLILDDEGYNDETVIRFKELSTMVLILIMMLLN